MTFKERLEALRAEVKSQIKPESSEEEITRLNGISAKLDELETDYNSVVTENAKFKDTIVKMVTTEGNSDKPKDEIGDDKPKTIEEIVQEELNKQGGKQFYGKIINCPIEICCCFLCCKQQNQC